MAFLVVNCTKPESKRQYIEFPPTAWGDYFALIGSKSLDFDQKVEKEVQALKEEVKNMLIVPQKMPMQKFHLIDSIQRLGVADHFQSEIQDLLDQANNTYVDSISGANDHNLHSDAVLFRLLRQEGCKVSSDIFKKYVDHERKFKEFLAKDVRELLSLYEAAHFSVLGEDILDEALNFATKKLEAIVGHLSYPLFEEVSFALKHPIRREMLRLQARHFMSIYEEDPHHNKAILTLSKLEYNVLQKLHQEELGEVSRWWKDMDLPSMLPFARDRIVECYLWALIAIPKPQYSVSRRFMTKLVQMMTTLDDIYDTYGTFEELKLLTDAIQRWDISAQDQLPDYLKFYYETFLSLFADFERGDGINIESFRLFHVKNGMKKLAKAYLGEANLVHTRYIPTIDEYYEFALDTSAYRVLSITAYLCTGDEVPKEAFDWIFTQPKIVRGAEIIGRLMNDMVPYKLEQVQGNIVSALECYTNQYGVSREEACNALQKQIDDAWKDINECCLKPTKFSLAVLSPTINLVRAAHFFYRDEDGFTIGAGATKLYIASLVVDPIPL